MCDVWMDAACRLGWVSVGRVMVSEKRTFSLATASHTFPSATCC